MEDLAWTLSLRSRVTTGQGCNQGEASPTYASKAYLLCGISILIYGGIWLFLGHEVVQFLVRFPVHGVFERCGVAGYAESFGQRRFDRAE